MTENMSAQHPEQTDRSSSAQRRGTMTCIVCKAVYAPPQWNKNLWQAPSAALESAFISMCHFCFRCRRPSCPNCWDGVHCVCGACIQDTGLSFRLESPPLSGTRSVSSQIQSTTIQPVLTPLICIRPGHLPGATPSIDLLPTRPERTSKKAVRRQRESLKAAKQESLISPSSSLATHHPVEKHRRSRRNNRRVRHLLTLFFLLIFVITFLIVINKNVSSNVNESIAKALLVDIRVRIAYLWQLIGHSS